MRRCDAFRAVATDDQEVDAIEAELGDRRRTGGPPIIVSDVRDGRRGRTGADGSDGQCTGGKDWTER